MRKTGFALYFAVGILVLVACSGQVTAVDEPAGTGVDAIDCPQAGPATRMLDHPQHGYCLLYSTA